MHVFSLPWREAFEQVEAAMEGEAEERLWQRYCTELPIMAQGRKKPPSYKEYKDDIERKVKAAAQARALALQPGRIISMEEHARRYLQPGNNPRLVKKGG
ncbi:hypothetical protein [Desmospora activa]|uniref:Uncharacterized protein n=1 Tax=Desmospora activa DSM 45169 TaxID=1121389 RepID=A0A2T4Z911_9BACL|nr:hypothetical protein [Desmospora activa]PTM58383.1 hypothetical protein C8J48_0965 [Desmospora activa DSM 45169]